MHSSPESPGISLSKPEVYSHCCDCCVSWLEILGLSVEKAPGCEGNFNLCGFDDPRKGLAPTSASCGPHP